jgi:hypothetical protein
MKHHSLIALLAFLLSGAQAFAQFGPQRDPSAPFDLKSDNWNARWISVPETGAQDYGVYYFRKDVDLASVPADYVVHVTGDNRYKLYVNGTLVSLGPAKGDATHWNYETVDLAPWLKAGKNAIAALVYHEGSQKPDSQASVSVGFLLQGEGNARMLYTDRTWKCLKDEAYSPLRPVVSGYYVAGPGEQVDLAKTPSDWLLGPTDGWLDARQGQAGEPKDVLSSNQGDGHNLVPSPLPQMERTPQRLASVRKADGVKAPAGFLEGKASLTIPANTKAELLLDNGALTNAYFNVHLTGGKGARLALGYAESLYIPAPQQAGPDLPPGMRMEDIPADVVAQFSRRPRAPRTVGKGNRDEVEDKVFMGREDVLLADGAAHEWTTLSWRTYRYVRVQVETADEPLTIKDLSGTFTGYPFELAAKLDTKDEELQKMLEIGWRTARLCAVETYMDCPYYEQLQYLGDTRIQALVSLYNAADDRLVKNFLRLADMSRNADGITKSRYPTTIPQYIQPYALSYIYALHDYLMYGADTDFVLDLVPGAEQIIRYFERYQLSDGRLKNLPGWNFSDWVNDKPSWNYGAPLRGADGCSINMDLQLLLAYQVMAELEEARGNTWQAGEYKASAEKLAAGVKAAYWNPARGLFADRAEQDNYSQHGNALAILCGIVDDPKSLAQKLLTDDSLAQCTIYYKFYLHEAYVKAGLGDDYLKWLDIWRENIAMGMTTWGEDANVFGTRSDCHAWGASPNIEFFRTVLGIDSDAVAFKRVRIEPHLGDLQEIGGAMPHPAGEISVHYKVKGKKLQVEVNLPKEVDGLFVWNGKEQYVRGGKNTFTL